MQEWGKRYGIINVNAVIIKFHNKSWAAIGCQMTSGWPSARAENHLEVIWQPRAAQDLLWNLIIKAFLVMILCCLPHSCTVHQTCNTRLICSYTLKKVNLGIIEQLLVFKIVPLGLNMHIWVFTSNIFEEEWWFKWESCKKEVLSNIGSSSEMF